jgi:hypothetical protein
MLGVCYPVEVL